MSQRISDEDMLNVLRAMKKAVQEHDTVQYEMLGVKFKHMMENWVVQDL